MSVTGRSGAMESIVEPKKRVPVARDADVVVAGGGISGMIAALTAAGAGARTVLVERFGRLGGNLGPGYLLGGTAREETDEFLRRDLPSVPRELFQRLADLQLPAPYGNTWAGTSQAVSYLAQCMAAETGLTLMLSAYAADPVMEGNRAAGLFVEGKSGRVAVRAPMVVDATGDANLARRAGAPIIEGATPDQSTYRLAGARDPVGCEPYNESAMFYLIGEVDFDRYERFLAENAAIDPKALDWATQHLRGPKVHRFPDAVLPLLHDAWRKGEFDSIRKLAAPEVTISSAGSHLQRCGASLAGGRAVNAAGAFDVGDMRHVTLLETAMRKQTFETVLFLRRHVPGFEKARLLAMSEFAGGRGGPCIEGRYTLTVDDSAKGRTFDDVLFRNFKRVPKLRPDWVETGCDIPYRILLPKTVEGMLVTGRGAAYVRRGHDGAGQMRGRPAMMALGEATGLAAALCARDSIAPSALDVRRLQTQLLARGFDLGDAQRLASLGLSES